MGKAFTALKALPARAIPEGRADPVVPEEARADQVVPVAGRADPAAQGDPEEGRAVPVVREDQVVPVVREDQVVPVAQGDPEEARAGRAVPEEDRVVPAGPVAQVVPGGPEEDRVDPAGTSDPAVRSCRIKTRALAG